jgi:hypothetical protein
MLQSAVFTFHCIIPGKVEIISMVPGVVEVVLLLFNLLYFILFINS